MGHAAPQADSSMVPSCIPQFVYDKDGFHPGLMVNKREPRTPPSLNSPSSASDVDRRRKRFIFPASADEANASGNLSFTFSGHVTCSLFDTPLTI